MSNTPRHEDKKREYEILAEIRNSESEAEQIIGKSGKESESILQEAHKDSSNILAENEENMRKSNEKATNDFMEKIRLLHEQKIADGRKRAHELIAKSEKKITKAVEYIMAKFEEMF